MEKPSLQSKFTLLMSKFFPAKIAFSKIQKKKFGGKKFTLQKTKFHFAKERGPEIIRIAKCQKIHSCIQ
jgi:hypothetical protein